MQVDVFNQQNEKTEIIDLPVKIFGVKWNPDLVHQVLATQLANRRTPVAHAKGRGEVRGGGKKPWRQKGTGRARHGSIRSPLWKGGGVTFGPTKERKFAKKINKRMKRLAIFSVLSKKLADNAIKIVDVLDNETKTKTISVFLKKMSSNSDKARLSMLLISASANKNIHRAISNIKNIDAISSYSLNIYDLLKYKNIILEKRAAEEIEEHYLKQ